ncbi:MAG: insulinase family protein [Calditerrivibrio sp.]|nr:insulinase family protein [Calditerrivibrio sp.]
MRSVITICFLTVFLLTIFTINIYAGDIRMLNNGITLLTEKRDYTNTVSVTVFFKGGIFRENMSTLGVGTLFSTVWLKSNPILEKIEYYGGIINTSVTYDYGELNLSIISEFSNEIIPEFEQFLLSPIFDSKVFSIEKNIQINRIKSIKDNANAVAGEGFNKTTYGNFPYSLNMLGTIESVSSLTPENIKQYYSNIMNGNDIIVSIAGNYTDSFLEKLIAIFSKVPVKNSSYSIDCNGSAITENRFVEEGYDRIKQAKLFLSYTAPSASDKNYLPIKLLSDILGGGMSSKYFNILRKEKGYAYSVGSYYSSRICNSRFVAYIGLQYENANDALEIMEKINLNIDKYISEEDILANKNYILGKILSEAQTNSKVAWYNAFFYSLGLGKDYFNKYIEGIKQITKEDLLKASEIFKKPKAVYILKPNSK